MDSRIAWLLERTPAAVGAALDVAFFVLVVLVVSTIFAEDPFHPSLGIAIGWIAAQSYRHFRFRDKLDGVWVRIILRRTEPHG